METLIRINELKSEHSRILNEASLSLRNDSEHLDEVTAQLIEISEEIDELFEQLSPTEVCLYVIRHFDSVKTHVVREMMEYFYNDKNLEGNPTIHQLADFAVRHKMVEEIREEYYQLIH